jgi:hypothetical protein
MSSRKLLFCTQFGILGEVPICLSQVLPTDNSPTILGFHSFLRELNDKDMAAMLVSLTIETNEKIVC